MVGRDTANALWGGGEAKNLALVPKGVFILKKQKLWTKKKK